MSAPVRVRCSCEGHAGSTLGGACLAASGLAPGNACSYTVLIC